MTNILFIAFEFPPLVRGGVYRSLAFTKYFPENDINPIVITLDRNSYAHTFDGHKEDHELGKEVISDRTIIGVPADKPKKQSKFKEFTSIYFSILGSEVNEWKGNFYQAVDQAVKEYSPGAVLVTVPPFSALELAEKVSKKYNLPLIVDFRDAFSQWRGVPYGSYGHYLATLRTEEKYLNAADVIVATSTQTLNDFKKLHPAIPSSRYHYIPNGYSGNLNPWKPITSDKKEFIVGYVGSFYYSPEAREQMFQPWWKKKGHRMLQYIPMKQDWLYRSPYFFFKALRTLKEKDPELGRRIKVKFAGTKPSWMKEMIHSFGLEDQVTLVGDLTHRQSLEFQLECDALLITSAKQIGGKDYSIAGKTFEYLQMQKPVIAFVCDGAQRELLEQSGTTLICDPDHTDDAASRMTDLFNGRSSFAPNYPFLAGLTRGELTRQLAELIKGTIQRQKVEKKL